MIYTNIYTDKTVLCLHRCLFRMSILYAYIVIIYFAFDKVFLFLLKNFTTTTTTNGFYIVYCGRT